MTVALVRCGWPQMSCELRRSGRCRTFDAFAARPRARARPRVVCERALRIFKNFLSPGSYDFIRFHCADIGAKRFTQRSRREDKHAYAREFFRWLPSSRCEKLTKPSHFEEGEVKTRFLFSAPAEVMLHPVVLIHSEKSTRPRSGRSK